MSRKRIKWTPEEDAELSRIYAMSRAGKSARAIAELVKRKGVKRNRIYSRAAEIGLTRVAGAHRRWTQAELDNLAHYAGRIKIRAIARILGRTDEAVKSQLHLLDLSGRVKARGYTRLELADLLGVDLEDTLKTLLKRFPIPTNLLGNFAESEVQLWLWEHLEDLELRKMSQPWLKAMLRKAAA